MCAANTGKKGTATSRRTLYPWHGHVTYQHLYTFPLFSAREFLLSVTFFSLSFVWNIIHACTGTHPANSERHSPSPLHHSYFQSDDGIFFLLCVVWWTGVQNWSSDFDLIESLTWAPTQERKGCEMMMMRHSHTHLERDECPRTVFSIAGIRFVSRRESESRD